MKMKILFGMILGALLVVSVGCVNTVSGRTRAGVPWVKDRVEDRYERPVGQVYDAAVEVIKFNGTLVNETTLHTPTNSVRTLEGRINQSTVWVRVEPLDAKLTFVAVQARTKAGGTDLDLAHEVSKQIAIQLVR